MRGASVDSSNQKANTFSISDIMKCLSSLLPVVSGSLDVLRLNFVFLFSSFVSASRDLDFDKRAFVEHVHMQVDDVDMFCTQMICNKSKRQRLCL